MSHYPFSRTNARPTSIQNQHSPGIHKKVSFPSVNHASKVLNCSDPRNLDSICCKKLYFLLHFSKIQALLLSLHVNVLRSTVDWVVLTVCTAQ